MVGSVRRLTQLLLLPTAAALALPNSYGRGSHRGASNRPQQGRWPPSPPRDYRRQTKVDDGEDDLNGEAVYGVTPVLSALRSRRRSFDRLILQDSLDVDKRTDRPALREIEQIATEAGIPLERRDKGSLNGLSKNRPHQGLVLVASPLEFVPLQALPKPTVGGDAPLWLALDEVQDPHNLGALLRTAFYLGVDGVLVSGKNTCPLTPAVSKASAGALELMDVHAARNLPRTLEAAKEAGWVVAGAALEQSVEPSELEHAEKPTVLVLGSEGHGLRTNVLRACSDLVRIPRGLTSPASAEGAAGGDAALVDSLNVSVAGGILLFSMLSARARAMRA
jgi:21S rRNA (GM2251-2'-O)-methyltransferase